MSKIDLVRLRKRAGLSQRELADILQVRPSFLSAIENGRSRIPDEKLEKLKEVFELDNFEDYIMEDLPAEKVPPHTHIGDESDSLTSLLNHFHDLAHQRSKSSVGDDTHLQERVDFLAKRNDRLSEKIDALRDEVDALRKENWNLKELLLKNGITEFK